MFECRDLRFDVYSYAAIQEDMLMNIAANLKAIEEIKNGEEPVQYILDRIDEKLG